MAKQISITAEVETTPLTVAVTGAPGGAGVAVPYSSASSNVTIANLGADVQYKVGSGAWVEMEKQDGVTLPINLAATTLSFRRATLDGGAASVELAIDGVPTLKTGASTIPTFSVDASGNVQGIAGVSFARYGSIKVGALGDSTVAGGLQSADGVTVQVSNAGTYLYPPSSVGFERGGAVSWLTHLCLQSNGRLILNHNGGVASDTSAGCLARLDYEISQAPQLLFMQMGMTNDIQGGIPAATSKANMQTAVVRVRAAGIQPVLVTCYPNSNATFNAAVRAWNEWVKFYGFANGIPVMDIYAAVVDPASTTGGWLAANTSDGVHATAIGASRAAQVGLAQLAAMGVIGGTLPSASAFSRLASNTLGVGARETANLLAAPLFNLGNTSGVATGWSFSGTGTCSINTAPGNGVIGSSQLITVTAGQKPSLAQDVAVVAGNRYAFACLFRTTGCAAGGVTYSIGTLNTFGAPQQQVIAAQNLLGVDFTGWTLIYIESVAQAGATLMRVNPLSLPVNATGDCTFEFAMPRLVNLSAL